MDKKEMNRINEILKEVLAPKAYNHEKPLDEIQTNDVVNFKGNDELGAIKEMFVDRISFGKVIAYKFFKNVKPGGAQKIEITEDSSKFTKIVVKSSLSNDPLTKAINYCNFTLAAHGLRVGQVYDENADNDVICEKYAIYKGKLYTKSILQKLETACLIVKTRVPNVTYEVYGDLDIEVRELEIDIDGGTIYLPNGKVLKITDTLKVRCDSENDLVLFKIPDGYISDQTVITEFWDICLDELNTENYGKLILFYSKGDE